ncbi:MAG TPA: heme ABC exporter ATP-binding protein CcmA [Methylomirabilota bacterium]|nr:heme ABC exporter ATP-binding protein CcmA [Methylomirabilota bacterium]
MTAEPLVHVVGLRKAFGGHFVLDDVALDVRPGEAVALLGPNGAGKTTLLRILATLARPTRGIARVAGHDCTREAERVRALVALVGHGTWVYDDLTALENLRFWATLGGQAADADVLRTALASVDLERLADERARTFSLGMKRRLALARLVLTRPRVLLLDEPFAALDQAAGKWLEARLTAFKAAGGAVLLTTHSFGRGLGVADRVAILAGGRVVLDTPSAALTAEDLRKLYALHVEDA